MKVLLVEDTRAVAALMMSRLAAFGCEVEHVENGRIAVDKFLEIAPDLVLMDIEMPVMSGFEATSRIRAIEATRQWAWTPIIFLTATATEENLITAIEAGGDDFMSKTMSEAVLQAKIKAMSRIAALRKRLSSANRQLEDLANRDGLTGLCNRRSMDLRVDAAWADALRNARPFALLMLDIDNFKKYNDCYGHQAGDDCLRRVAEVIAVIVDSLDCSHAGELAPGPFVARYGGEEFSVILPGATLESYRAVAQEILAAIRACVIPHEMNAEWGIITLSIGGCHIGCAAGAASELFRQADMRLYQAKKAGRNRAEL